jgi:hypothetical protein
VIAIGADRTAPVDAEVFDCAGLIVGPGFVDVHSHVHSVAGHRLAAFDGVTTALDLEAGLMPVERAYHDASETGRPLNYGFSASWSSARAQVLAGVEPTASIWQALRGLSLPVWQRSSSGLERTAWLRLLEGELEAGALGIGVLLGYAPRTEPIELLAAAKLARAAGAPTFVHVRELVEADPGTPVDGSMEVVMVAAETGAAMHHCHVNSTSRRHIDRVLATLADGQREGSRITVEAYPYGSGSTAIGAVFLAPDRLGAWGLSPSDLVLVETGERIADSARLRDLRERDPGAACIVEFLDEGSPDDQRLLEHALAFDDAIIASDAMPIVGLADPLAWPLRGRVSTHPRSAGTYARTARMMVRESATWTWLEAFRRCSYLPARLLDEVAPAMRTKGWLDEGADADIVALDPNAVTDAATYLDPVRPSRGVRYLLVGGEFVIRNAELQLDAMPGSPIRAGLR